MPRISRQTLAVLALPLLSACEPPGGCSGDFCGTLVIAAVGEPDNLLPPVTENIVARDIHDQLFLKLADLGAAGNTIGDVGFEPLLAQRWSWQDSLTLVFHLDSRARWHDGPRVTAEDVAFSFAAYTDPEVNSPFRESFAPIASVTTRDSLTAVFRFRTRSPESFFTAVYTLRILPAHLLRDLPRGQWITAPFGRQPIGNGPYRFAAWTPGVSIELVADSSFFLGRPHIRRLIWRPQPDHPTAVTQVIAGEADAIEVLVTPENVRRASAASRLALYPYPGTTFGFLGFNLSAGGSASRPHPLFGDRELRRALVMAVDRARLLRSVFGDLARVPPGPIPTSWPLWEPRPRELPYDTAAAARLLATRGWTDQDGDGVREKSGTPLAFRILLPTTSGVRRQYARLLQEQLRAVGVRVELDEVELPVFGERAGAGRFDALLGGWNVDPTPSAGIGDLWTRRAIGGPNWLRYQNAAFERLVDRASSGALPPDSVRATWREALGIFNDDAPAAILFATDNVAAVDRRVAGVRIRPDSYWALVRTWRIPAGRLTERDRLVAAR